ncbi:MAG TPA: peptidase M49 [Bacteroidota bacterium]|nr:peptidase M49 [Bacteroidota bacterium]
MDRLYTLEKLSLNDVGPVRIVQLYADGFEHLALNEKLFVYYLSQAAIAGRDIAIDQRHKDGLTIRDLLEAVCTHPEGVDERVADALRVYTKLFWVNNGIHDDITSRKFMPDCSFDEFTAAVRRAVSNGAAIESVVEGESLDALLARLRPVMFDPRIDPVRTNKTPGEDMLASSANNLYEGATFAEVDAWAKSGREHYGLNSKLVRRDGAFVEEVYRTGTLHLGGDVPPGRYAADLEAVIGFLLQARPFAATDNQQQTIDRLIEFYRTGETDAWRAYTISWLADTETRVDFIHGFIEVYLDARGVKGQYEAIVNFADPDLTRMIQRIGSSAQYFEDRMPWDELYKKTDVQPLKASVINVVVETGDAGPVSAIGINLPNEEDIRERFGSKSVSLNNIVDAYEKSGGRDIVREFSFDDAEYERFLACGRRADNLHTALHEILGHGSGRMNPAVSADPHTLLPGLYSTLEETRADLVALWHIWDEKLKEIGAVENDEIARAMYDKEVRNAWLIQLQRVPKGADQLEEDHMKNRQLIVHWLTANTGAIERLVRDGKTFVRVTDYQEMRSGVGRLLAEVMRIKAEGDYHAAAQLINTYGLKIDTALRDEVLFRMEHLDRAVYTGFVMPRLEPVTDETGRILDITVSYPCDLARQMLDYSAFTRAERARTRSAFRVRTSGVS